MDWPNATWKEYHLITLKGGPGKETKEGPSWEDDTHMVSSCGLFQPVTLTLALAPQSSLGVAAESLALLGVHQCPAVLRRHPGHLPYFLAANKIAAAPASGSSAQDKRRH